MCSADPDSVNEQVPAPGWGWPCCPVHQASLPCHSAGTCRVPGCHLLVVWSWASHWPFLPLNVLILIPVSQGYWKDWVHSCELKSIHCKPCHSDPQSFSLDASRRRQELSLAISQPPLLSGCWIMGVHQQAILNPFTPASLPDPC